VTAVRRMRAGSFMVENAAAWSSRWRRTQSYAAAASHTHGKQLYRTSLTEACGFPRIPPADLSYGSINFRLGSMWCCRSDR
jgi:hypothetical protein